MAMTRAAHAFPGVLARLPGAGALHRPAGTHALAARFPAAFVPNGVGTRYEFAATDA